MIEAPVLVAGRDALAGLDLKRTDEAYLSRLPLRRSGALPADGKPHPLGSSVYRNRKFAVAEGQPPPDTNLRLEGTCIFGGVVSQHFGHVLTQSLGRLWAHELAPEAPILFLPETLGVTALPGYLVDLARSFGIENELRLLDRSAAVSRLLLPQDICNLAYRPSATPHFRDWLARSRPTAGPELSGRLYVSRSRLGLQAGQYLQETVLETALAANGYTVFHPQEHSVAAQFAAYSTASHMIFADGSAAHMWSLAAREGQTAAVILRRPRDRQFARWFRSLDSVKPHYLDFAIADFWRSGEGPGRSVALLDLQALWDQLRALGFHGDARQIGIDRSRLEAWVTGLPPRMKPPVAVPFDLDDLSRDILSQRRYSALRPLPENP